MNIEDFRGSDVPDDGTENDSFRDIGRFLWEIIKVVVLAVVIIVPIRVFLFQPFFVQGASMEPNFEDGEYLIVNELGYKETAVGLGGKNLLTVKSFKKLERGDVIIFHPPRDEERYFIKRVVALPGETIEIRESRIAVTGSDGIRRLLDESGYLGADVTTAGNITRKLLDDEYYVLGDNRQVSSDSRSWGPIKKKEVIGKVLLRAWPLNRMDIY